MKRDPFSNPIALAGRSWSYIQHPMSKSIIGYNFWNVARKMLKFRLANKLSGANFDQCQMDLIVSTRKKLGLNSDEKAEPKPVVESNDSSPKSPVKEFVEKHYKRKGGCRSCGQKRIALTLIRRSGDF